MSKEEILQQIQNSPDAVQDTIQAGLESVALGPISFEDWAGYWGFDLQEAMRFLSEEDPSGFVDAAIEEFKRRGEMHWD